MSENLHNIDKLFRDGLDGHEDMPSAKLWDAIDAGLDKSNVVHIQRKYKNLKRIAAVLLLLLCSGIGYEIFKTKTGDNDLAAGTEKNSKDKTTATIKKEKIYDTISGSQSQNDNDAATNTQAQNNSVANAGYDSAANASPANNTTVSANKKASPKITDDIKNKNSNSTTVLPVTVSNGKTDGSNKKQQNKLPVTVANTDKGYNNRTAGNKSANNRTKVKIKKPQPLQYDNDNAMGEDEQSDATVLNNTTTLTSLQNTPATLAERINRVIDANALLAVDRQSPNVAIKTMRRSKSFHFSIMPFFSPQFVSNKLKEENRNQWSSTSPGGPPPPRPDSRDHKEQYKGDEQEQTAYSIGILAEVPLGKKWSVQSGITYLNKTIDIEPKKIYARTDKDGKVKYVFDCSSGYSYIASKTGTAPAVGDSITATTSKNSLGYIGIPLSVNYKFSLGKFSIIPGAGTVLNLLTKKKIETELVKGNAKEQQSTNNIDGLKPNYLSATAGVAFEYNVNKRIAVNIMPSGNFALTSINNSDAAVKSYPNAFAVSGGVKIKF